MKFKNIAIISSILYAINCEIAPNGHQLTKSSARTRFHPLSTPAPGSLANTLVIDPTDPNQTPQPPLIFTSGHNPPQPVFGAQSHIPDNTFVFTSGNRIHLSDSSMMVPAPAAQPASSKQPPFFVRIQRSQPIVESNITKKPKPPTSAPIVTPKPTIKRKPTIEPVPHPTPALPKPQPLPASTKPMSEKHDCVVLGRAGHCVPVNPMENIFKCFRNGGIVALDIVRCSWVKACCVPNFFR